MHLYLKRTYEQQLDTMRAVRAYVRSQSHHPDPHHQLILAVEDMFYFCPEFNRRTPTVMATKELQTGLARESRFVQAQPAMPRRMHVLNTRTTGANAKPPVGTRNPEFGIYRVRQSIELQMLDASAEVNHIHNAHLAPRLVKRRAS